MGVGGPPNTALPTQDLRIRTSSQSGPAKVSCHYPPLLTFRPDLFELTETAGDVELAVACISEGMLVCLVNARPVLQIDLCWIQEWLINNGCLRGDAQVKRDDLLNDKLTHGLYFKG